MGVLNNNELTGGRPSARRLMQRIELTPIPSPRSTARYGRPRRIDEIEFQECTGQLLATALGYNPVLNANVSRFKAITTTQPRRIKISRPHELFHRLMRLLTYLLFDCAYVFWRVPAQPDESQSTLYLQPQTIIYLCALRRREREHTYRLIGSCCSISGR